jgi:competence protein ComFC
MGFLDLIFPKKCVSCKKQGEYLCAGCFSYLSFNVKNLCLVCNKPSIDGSTHLDCVANYMIDGCFSSLSYNKTVQKMIYSFKHKPYLTDSKQVLGDLFYEGLIQNEGFIKEITTPSHRLRQNGDWQIVPVPLYPTKQKKRGYNQAEILAKDLGKKFNIPVKNLLKRIRDTKAQVELKTKERKVNIKGAFSIIHNSEFMINNSSIFLIDDVVTTGSTLLECANVLKRAGAKRVFGVTLARD